MPPPLFTLLLPLCIYTSILVHYRIKLPIATLESLFSFRLRALDEHLITSLPSTLSSRVCEELGTETAPRCPEMFLALPKFSSMLM